MKRSWQWAVLLIALLVVVACRPVTDFGEQATAEPGETEELEPGLCPPDQEDCGDEEVEQETEAAQETVEPTAVPEPTEVPADDPTVEPEVTVDVEALLAVKETDWVKGAGEEPVITLLEYADFL